MFLPTIMEYRGRWQLNAKGRELAVALAQDCEPLRALQSSLLWAETARILGDPSSELNGKSKREGGGR